MIEKMIKLEHININVRYLLSEKPVILFLHFSGGNSHMWEGILPQFENEYSIIAPDFRGHGKSEKPSVGYHIDDMAKDTYLLLEKLNIKKCHIVGSSMGGEVGLSLAASHPEIVLSLICEGAIQNEFGEYSLFNGTDEEIEHKKEVMRAELGKREERVFRSKEEYVGEEQAKLTQYGLWNEYFLTFFEHNLQQMENGDFGYSYLNYVRIECIQNFWDVKFEEYLKKIKCAVLFLPSEDEWEDDKTRSIISSFASLLHTYEIDHIENSIHAYVWMQLPIEIGKLLKEFIIKHQPAEI